MVAGEEIKIITFLFEKIIKFYNTTLMLVNNFIPFNYKTPVPHSSVKLFLCKNTF